jgi:diguanylate cyclase (GGDEF)-like protein
MNGGTNNMMWDKQIQATLMNYIQNDSPFPLLVLSSDGTIQSCNKAFEALIHDTHQLVGLPCDELLVIHQYFEQQSTTKGYILERFLGSLKSDIDASVQLRGVTLQTDQFNLILFQHYMMDDHKIVEQMSQMTIELSTLTRTLTKKNIALEKANERITHLLNVDHLTDVYNRQYFFQKLNTIIGNDSEVNLACIGIISMDIDFFKKVNDTYGHDVGDIVLISFAQTLQNTLVGDDIIARIGGEEFSALVYGCQKDHLIKLAETIRKAVEAIVFTQKDLKITASFGVTIYEKQESVHNLMKRADLAMYEAKQTGRNRVVFK